MTPRTRSTPLSARLAELGAAVPVAQQRARECETTHRRVVAEIEQLTDVVADAYADDDETRAAKASKQRAALESGSLREAEERLEGAKRAVSRAEADRGLFAAEHLAGLLRERVDAATTVAQAAVTAVEQLGQAHAAWNAEHTEVSALLRLAGQDTREMPRFPEQLEQLVREARRVGGVQVPAPLPGNYDPPRPALRAARRSAAEAFR